ncbi:MAG: hypothetical protein KDH19_03460, partial [Geminicoccaceae bacterium]|nr:hypothetical protein [Geminicoccaceae bacterium]
VDIGSVEDSDISGNLNQSTFVGGAVVNTAGFLGKATTEIGKVENASIGGNATQNTTVLGAVTTSGGFLADACTSIGSLGSNC